MTGATCGNANHPSGSWHETTPLPFSWQWGKRIHQWLNRERWGCRCDKGNGGEGNAALLGLVTESDEGQQVLGTCSPERFPNLRAALTELFRPEPWPEPERDETTPGAFAAFVAKHKHPAGCDGTDNCGCVS